MIYLIICVVLLSKEISGFPTCLHESFRVYVVVKMQIMLIKKIMQINLYQLIGDQWAIALQKVADCKFQNVKHALQLVGE